MAAGNLAGLLAGLLLALTGCTVERTLKLDARLSRPPVVRQLPRRVGVYYSPEFVGYSRTIGLMSCGLDGRRGDLGVYFIFPIGPASRELFDQIAARMFATVTPVAAPPPYPGGRPPLDGILVPQIASFDWNLLCGQATGYYEARVVYLIALYDGVDGRLVATLPVVGRGLEKPKVCLRDCRDSVGTEQALRDAMAAFMVEFPEQPEVRQWLSRPAPAPGAGP